MYEGKKICVVIPAYNEEATIGLVIDSIENYVDYIVVVDDGSSDNTARIAEEKGAIVESHGENKGLGSAFRTGVDNALETDADIMVNLDADGQFNPKDITKLIEPIIKGRAGFVTASRFKEQSYYPVMPKSKLLGNKLMSLLVSIIIGKQFYDVSCGFRAYSRDTLLRLNLFGKYTYTHETFIDLAFKDVKMHEVPVIVKGEREFGESKVASSLFKYAYKTIKIIIKIFRDYNSFRLYAAVSLITFLTGLISGVLILIYFVNTGAFTPYKSVAFASGFFIVLSILFFALGFITDMFSMMRRNQEEMLYILKCIKDSQRRKI